MAAALDAVHWSDVPALTEIERQVYGPDVWSARSWWSELALRPQRCYIALRAAPMAPTGCDDQVVPGARELLGYAGLSLGAEVADVMTVTLRPAARGHGYGHTLLSWLIEQAEAAGARHLMLEVRSDNAAACRLYHRWGFAQISVRPGYYHGADALILRRPLGADTSAVPSPAPPSAESTVNTTDPARNGGGTS